MVVVGARKLGQISCGNGVITSPITTAIRVEVLQKSGNKAYRHTNGHSWGGIRNDLRHHTYTKLEISWAYNTRLLYQFTRVLRVWRHVFQGSHVMNPTRRFPSTRGSNGTMDDAAALTWLCEPWKCFWGGRHHVKNERKKHTNICSGFFSHIHRCPHPKTHTLTQSEPTAKHTTHYIWTVSLAAQTRVDSLTLDLSMYDYSSSSYCGLGYDPATHNTEPPLLTFKSNLYFQLLLHTDHRKEGIHIQTDQEKTKLAVRPLFLCWNFSIMSAFWKWSHFETNLVIQP